MFAGRTRSRWRPSKSIGDGNRNVWKQSGALTRWLLQVIVDEAADKCYKTGNGTGDIARRSIRRYDPYSASKAAAEIVTAAYRSSYFGAATAPAIATVRAGNVIGGGSVNWSQDRLVPDMVRAFRECQPVLIRNPRAIRPWQHVLEPIEGYVYLAERLVEDGAKLAAA